MKNGLIAVLLLMGIATTAKGQSNSFGLSLGVGDGFIIRAPLDGAASYELNTGYSFGLQYTRKSAHKLHLVTGLHFYTNSLTVTPELPPDLNPGPSNYDIQLLYIPLLHRINLSDYIFFTSGLIGIIDITKDKYLSNQSGLGIALGMGAEFPINDKLFIQLNPYLNLHGLLLAHGDNYPERVLDAGIKLNLMFNK